MSTKNVGGGRSAILSVSELRKRLAKLEKEDIIELMAETLKAHKDVRAVLTVKLLGESAVAGMLKAYQEQVDKQFFPKKGRAPQRVTVIEQLVASMNELGLGTPYPFQFLVGIVESAVRYLEENGDMDEDMCLLIGDYYEEIVQLLNAEEADVLFRQYQARLEAAIRKAKGNQGDMYFLFKQSYSQLKWVDPNELDEGDYEEVGLYGFGYEHDDDGSYGEISGVGADANEGSRLLAGGSLQAQAKAPKGSTKEKAEAGSTISFAAMKQWLEIAEPMRKRILGNVFCGKCGGAASIKDYSVGLEKYGLVLQGKCSTCESHVVRVVD